MKRSMRVVCILLTLSLLLAIPARAESAVEPRASAFFSSYGTDLYKTSSTSFQIWFDVNSNGSAMQVLGVSEIEVYRSLDQSNWVKVKTYKMADYPVMTDENTGSYGGYVTYSVATIGCYYTALITFYAKNSTGVGEIEDYTEIIKMG